jgi:elongator complex protein 3
MLQERGVVCQCIRCREARVSQIKANQVKLFHEEYITSSGQEIFITFEDKTRTTLYAFCRLRLPSAPTSVDEQVLVRLRSLFPKLHDTALIRELHTYGQLIPIKTKMTAVQHLGFGKRLMLEAERIARANGYKKMVVISGIGVRAYYRKLGYRLEDTYMVKRLT